MDFQNKLAAMGLRSWLKLGTREPNWLIKEWMMCQGLHMCSGPRKIAGKTWFAIDNSLSVALGSASPGSILTVPHDGKRVLFIEEEGTGPDTRSRHAKLLKGRGLDVDSDEFPEAMAKLEKNYLIMHHPRIKLDNPQWCAWLVDYVKGEGIELVVLDAITYMTSGDENSKQDQSRINDALFGVRAAGAAVLYLVHTNKQGQREDADPDLDVRGSTVLLDAYDAHFALRRRHDSYIDLLARYRDFEEGRYRISWDYKPDRVAPTLWRVTAEDEARTAVQDFVVQLVPGVDYNNGTLKKQLGLSSDKEAAKLLNQLVNAGALVAQSPGIFRKR